MSVCMSVCLSLESDFSETVHHQTWHGLRHGNASHANYIDLDLHIEGRTDLNHKNNKCSVISETVQAIPIKFAVKIVRLKV